MKTEINRDPVGEMVIETVTRPLMANEISASPARPAAKAPSHAVTRPSLLARRYARWDRRAARSL
jgi:hypothetical protein